MHKREKIFANQLDKQNRRWIYAPNRFKTRKGYYRPDFYLPNENLYIEVVGSRQAYHQNKDKLNAFRKEYPMIKFFVVDYLGNKYPNEKIKIFKSICISLNEKENAFTEDIIKRGYTPREIFKKGLAELKRNEGVVSQKAIYEPNFKGFLRR